MAMAMEAVTMAMAKATVDKRLCVAKSELSDLRCRFQELVTYCESVIENHDCSYDPQCSSEEIENDEACGLCQIRHILESPPEE